MQVWPAIDLRGGRCVRLSQGDYQRETVYDADPAAVARRLVDEGAECLHLVDLDGARDGRPANLAAIAAIVQTAGVPCELGGGIRSEQTIRTLIELGLTQLVVGTKALAEPDWLRSMARLFPERIVLGIDAREGRVATHGWLKTSDMAATELALQFQDEPLAAIVYTDIATDGMLSGPNVPEMATMQRAVSLPVVASGGVTTAADVAALAAIPMAGCIIGKALYEGRLALRDALVAAAKESR